MAQVVVHIIGNDEVPGPSPGVSSKTKAPDRMIGGFFVQSISIPNSPLPTEVLNDIDKFTALHYSLPAYRIASFSGSHSSQTRFSSMSHMS